MTDFKNTWGLITGASAGIGEAYARAFAQEGMNLILVARREDRLQKLAQELRNSFETNVIVKAVDLLSVGQPDNLIQELTQFGPPVDLLVNNAGFGVWTKCETTDPAQVDAMLRLNILVLTQLTYAFLPQMLSRGAGTIINVASRAAFQPVPFMPAYAASKAYALSFSEALWAETKGRGVHVMAICPGVVKTEFLDLAHMPKRFAMAALSCDDVVQATLRGLRRKQPTVVVGLIPKLMALLPRILPRTFVARMAIGFMKPSENAEE